MAVITAAANSDNSSDVNFRAWATQISNAMALAWIQTSDTGQINLATTTRSGSVGTPSGYQIWRMNDSLQSTTPCYLKLEYGTGSSGSASGVWISVGTGTDGAGTLTGSSGIRFNQSCSSGGACTFRCSIDTNRVAMYLWHHQTNSQCLFCIERTHNISGADTSNGIMCFISGYFGASSWVIIPGVTTTSFPIWNATLPSNVTSSAWANNIFTYPVRAWGQGETSPSNQLCMYFVSDITALNAIPLTTWEGVNRTMLPTGAVGTIAGFGPALAQQGVAMRWE